MEYFTVYTNSIIGNIVATIPYNEITKLKELAKEETVSIELLHDYCRVIGRSSRKMKIPKKATVSYEGLVKWLEERIMSAWV